MRTRWLVISIALAAGCRDKAVEQLEHIKADLCACTTRSCADGAMKRVPQHGGEPSHRSQQIAKDMLDCLSKLYAHERPTTGPDAPADDVGSAGPAARAP